jgi:predicted nucleic-acid-binding protein
MPSSAPKLPDTNTIIRYLIKDEPSLFEEASAFFDSVLAGEQRVVILESVLVECVYVLQTIYKVPKEHIVDSMTKMLRYRGIANADKEELISALAIFRDKNIAIVDCILAAKAKSYNMTLFTFDKKLNTVFKQLE